MNQNIQQMIHKIRTQQKPSKDDLVHLLGCEPSSATALFAAADSARRRYVGDEIHLRGIIEFSNHCRRSCRYCGLRKENTNLKRYRMGGEEIYEAALAASRNGCKTIVLQSGEDSYYDADTIARAVKMLKKLGLAVTLSCGERPEEEYKYWRQAGADRYLLKHETANQVLYSQLHPDMTYNNRLGCLTALKALGYQVGSGCMVGLPGQTAKDLAEDLLLLKELDVEMAGIGPFIPSPHTPLADASPGTAEMTLKMIALARLLLPQAHLPATTALSTIDPLGRKKALQCGANVIMPNVTPQPYRHFYEIYPNKDREEARHADCRQQVETLVHSLGRSVAKTPGHSPKQQFTRERQGESIA